jgi:hypothetical protein
VGGEEAHLLSGSESGVAAHTHPCDVGHEYLIGGGTEFDVGVGSGFGSTLTIKAAVAANAAASHNTMHPYQVTEWIIKT